MAARKSPVMSPLRALLEEAYGELLASSRLPLWSLTSSRLARVVGLGDERVGWEQARQAGDGEGAVAVVGHARP